MKEKNTVHMVTPFSSLNRPASGCTALRPQIPEVRPLPSKEKRGSYIK